MISFRPLTSAYTTGNGGCQKSEVLATRIFLQWYVTEQVEEEENDNEIIDQLKLIKDHPQGLLILDRGLRAQGDRPSGLRSRCKQRIKIH